MTRLLPAVAPAVALALSLIPAGAAVAQDAYTRTVQGDFADVTFALEQAIVGEGLVIDLSSHVGEMLDRTKADVGGTKDIFTQADTYSFCSSRLSRQVMEADPANVQYCPYAVFAYETPDAPGTVVVGHRVFPGETMAPVNEMLNRIVDAATQ